MAIGSANFEPTRWDHWLLVACFVGIAIWGIWLSWRWERETQKMRQRARTARLMTMGQYRSAYRTRAGLNVMDQASSAKASVLKPFESSAVEFRHRH